ncbi:MAG: FtsQ-type POTRA domain-containing protein [Actinobacteria bacterium]|nr:FtsQ-type POTRA domain-containing protein [Actinomycetota bacterium]
MPTLLRDRASAPRQAKRDKPSRRERRAERKQAAEAGQPASDAAARAFYVDDTGQRRIDPRIRARRDAVQLGHKRKRLRRLVVLVVIVSLGAAGYFLVNSSLLSARSVEITGGPNTSVDDIRAAAAIGPDERMLDVNERAIAQRVEQLPWVDTATVQRRWPRSVTISVTERKLAALLQDGAGGWLAVDGTGRVLGPTPDISNVFVTHIAGVAPVPAGQTVDGRIGGALAVAGKLTAPLSGRTSMLTVTPEGSVELKLLPRGTVNLGRADDSLDAKVGALRTMLAQADLRDLCRLDLRVPTSPVLTRDAACL